MNLGLIIVFAALAYLGALFLVAYWGDKARPRVAAGSRSAGRSWIYPLSLAVYCTSWTFFGSVGLASRQGFDFLAIYIGPIVMFAVFWPLIVRVVRLAKAQNITSVADFIGSRYGKNQTVAAIVALIVLVGTVPYVALQLKAVSASLLATLEPTQLASITKDLPFFGDLALLVAMAMAAFAMLFGTRHADATEHQEGMMLAVAMESVVKLICFLVVGVYVTYVMFGGLGDLFARAADRPDIVAAVARWPDAGTFLTMCLLSFCCAILLPRMFHVAVVENHSAQEVRKARWVFPFYLVLINVFVVPIAVAGMLSFEPRTVDGDMMVVSLPLHHGSEIVTLLAFIGGLSAATAMVIVATVALSIMVSNDIVIPAMLKLRGRLPGVPDLGSGRLDVGETILKIRRTIILFVLIASYFYYRVAGDAQLAAIGLLSFAAVSQLAPAFFGGLFWRGANARGAILGMAAGIAVWAYTLLLPMLARSGAVDATILLEGPWGIEALRPEALFGVAASPLAHGVLWSLALNFLVFLLGSSSRKPRAIETLQADLFIPSARRQVAPPFRFWRPAVTVGELQATVARYLGRDRAEAAFIAFAAENAIAIAPDAEADVALVRHAERLLASAIGAASARLVLSLVLRKRTVSTEAALSLLDGAHAAMQYNREILQTALEHARQAVSVFDAEGKLVVWNRPLADTLALPPGILRMGVGFEDVLRELARRGEFGPGEPDRLAAERVSRLLSTDEPYRERLHGRGLVVEIRSASLPDGGRVTTYTDVTATVAAEEALERANESLEQRVRERTEELTRLNAELARAKAAADEANLSKTRFLAAASHDILQPLNAARLYTTTLVDKLGEGAEAKLVGNVDASLEAVEEILGALLDISRLDAGAMKPDVSAFRLDDVMRQLALEFSPIAKAQGLRLDFVPTSKAVRSDRRLLRRLLQNLISNAIKYTAKGRVLVGCRRRGGKLVIEVWDTGAGIPPSKQTVVFREFQRLDDGARMARGLGLGLSIVQRIGRVLGHRVTLRSVVGKGSCFAVEVPVAAAMPAMTAAPTAPTPEPGALGGVRVLAIDNEPKIIEGMTALLGGWGCEAVGAASAVEAIAELSARGLTPDILLVDYHLDGGATGFEAITQLRWRFGDDVPAVLITADRSLAVREEAQRRDVHVLNKPVRPAALRALLSRGRVRREAAE